MRHACLLVVAACSSNRDPKRDPAPVGSAAPVSIDAAAIDSAAIALDATGGAAITFDADPAATLPSLFRSLRTGPGALGRWEVQRADDAPSTPHVLVQLDPDRTVARFPVLVAEAPRFRNGRVSVRCKAVSGRVDQACGLVIRFADENNYYVTRSNVLEDNIRLYHVVKGKRTEIASYAGEVAQGWHELAIEAQDDHFRVSWDGTQVIEHRDTTLDKPGKAGLWTKADSVTQFDDLVIESFDRGSP